MAAYWALFATRCLVGVGEGAYGPVAPAMIADLYPVEKRGRIMAWFYVAIPVGGALGYAFGEVVKDLLDWRWAFPPGSCWEGFVSSCASPRVAPAMARHRVEGSTSMATCFAISRSCSTPSA